MHSEIKTRLPLRCVATALALAKTAPSHRNSRLAYYRRTLCRWLEMFLRPETAPRLWYHRIKSRFIPDYGYIPSYTYSDVRARYQFGYETACRYT